MIQFADPMASGNNNNLTESLLPQVSYLEIAAPVPLRHTLTYFHEQPIQPGCRVQISVGKRKLVGLVMSVHAHNQVEHKLKPVLRQIDQQPLVSEHLLNLFKWAASYYQYPIGLVVQQALPAKLRQGDAALVQQEMQWQLSVPVEQIELSGVNRAPKQAALLQLFLEHDGVLDKTQLDQFMSNWRPALQGLLKKNLLTQQAREKSGGAKSAQYPLTDAQQHIVQHCSEGQGFRVDLLHGITGSGKTEVYLQLCQRTIANQQQALVIVPEIGLTPQLLQRFQQRFSCPVLSLHSGLSNSERCQHWLMSAQDSPCIVIGTRSAAFAPMSRLGLIIIDEEHDHSLKQQDNFRFSARDILIKRAQELSIPILLGSATPSLESLAHAWQGQYGYHELNERATGAKLPRMEIVDLRSQHLNQGLSNYLLDKMQQTLAQHQQVLLFLNRRGFAPVMLCHDCGWCAHCQRCDSHMSLFKGTSLLRCHHCDAQQPAPRVCPKCQSEHLIALGEGTERVEAELQARFPEHTILRIDRDSTRKKGSFARMLEQIQSGEADILLGTQMLAKGHDFPKVTLVGVLNTDQGLYSQDFRAMEHMGQLLIQVAGRSGRAENPGQVLVQTHLPDHPLLLTLLSTGYKAFARQLLQEREAAQLPPYGYLSLLRAESAHEQQALDFLRLAKHCLLPHLPNDCALWGPVMAPMAKRGGRYRAQLMLQHQHRKGRTALLKHWLDLIDGLKESRKVRWSLDVDPLSLY